MDLYRLDYQVDRMSKKSLIPGCTISTYIVTDYLDASLRVMSDSLPLERFRDAKLNKIKLVACDSSSSFYGLKELSGTKRFLYNLKVLVKDTDDELELWKAYDVIYPNTAYVKIMYVVAGKDLRDTRSRMGTQVIVGSLERIGSRVLYFSDTYYVASIKDRN